MTTEATQTQSAQDACAAAVPGLLGLPAGFDDNLGWLLAQCFRAHLSSIDQATADLPHGPRGYQVLAGAVHRSSRSQAELAKQLGLDRTVMVYLVDDLERAGLVERLPDPNDRRSRLIRATAVGTARLAELDAAVQDAEARLLSPLSGQDQARLHTMLREIVAAHHAAGAPVEEPCAIAEKIAQSGC
ncbi:MAG TPA: MarR family transcriptional regulator [Actinocrinis sp.]|nr:MarR family transcriptional regulator [Actinocrinis sp.]